MLDAYIFTTLGPLRGTHDSIERFAFASLSPSDRQALPCFSAIRAFSGPLGPDTLWAIGRLGAERSRYDPVRQVGDGLTECQSQLRALLAARTTMERSRAAGRLAHSLADLCDPAHHVGRAGVTRVRVFGRMRTER